MECHLQPNRNSRDQEASVKIYAQSSHQASQSTKLGDRFKLDRLEPSYADFHTEGVRNVDSVSQKSEGFHQKQQGQRKADELVRYMSNLPSYLESGEKLQEKAFNVGVLEWRRLEKWQNNQRQLPHQSYRSSPSSSTTSSFSSTEGSSSYSSRGHSCSPARQRMHRTSVGSNLHASPSKVCHSGIKSSEKNGVKSHDLVSIPSNYLKVQQSILKTHQCFNKYTEKLSTESKNKPSDPQSISEKGSGEPENQSMTSNSKGKLKIQDGDIEEKEKLKGPNYYHTDQHCKDKQQTVVLLRPKDSQETRIPASSNQCNSTGKCDRAKDAGRRSNFDESNSKAYELSLHIPHSCPVPCEADAVSHPQIEEPSSIRAKGARFSSEMSQSLAYSGSSSVSAVRDENMDDKKLTKTLPLVEGKELKVGTEEGSTQRNPSPVRRFSFSRGVMGRNSTSKDTSCVPQCNHHTRKSGSGGAQASVSSVDPSFDKSNANGRARSSPLRRLLDPLLKPRAGSPGRSIGSSERTSAAIDKDCKLSNRRAEAPALHSVKVKLDLGSCKDTDIDHPLDLGKCGSTMVQALLQVTVKNALPLFTFAVDNSSDILAATMRRLSSGSKDRTSWIYTFFTVHEMKKKNRSWLNQASKDRSHGYTHNVVGQMKVSDVPTTDLIRKSSVHQCSIREFVLLAMNRTQADQQTSELQENDDLAAIVLKLPKMPPRNLIEGGQRRHNSKYISTMGLKETSEEVFCDPLDYKNAEESGPSAGRADPLGLTVILPGGDHSLPSKGKPSPLIERWRFGGSCDCGGWDEGCRLRVLINHSQFSRRSDKMQSAAGKFQLYSQEQALDKKPIFSLSLFKDGIYSVEFDSSIKLLQAFSICIAVLNGLKPAEFPCLNNFTVKKSSEEPMFSDTDGAKVSDRDRQEIPASFISCPPGSPVDRV